MQEHPTKAVATATSVRPVRSKADTYQGIAGLLDGIWRYAPPGKGVIKVELTVVFEGHDESTDREVFRVPGMLLTHLSQDQRRDN